ncbi:hypothetical protein D3C78_1432120 [compost metagenome]
MVLNYLYIMHTLQTHFWGGNDPSELFHPNHNKHTLEYVQTKHLEIQQSPLMYNFHIHQSLYFFHLIMPVIIRYLIFHI